MTGSSPAKELFRNTLLNKRWMLTEMCWKRNAASLSSPDTDEMRRPSEVRNSMAEVLRAPRFSTAQQLSAGRCSFVEGQCMWPISSRQLIIIIILTLVKTTVRKKFRNRKCWKDYCSGRSSNTKPSCNKTELNRNSKTEIRWNKKEVSLSSPELREILRPRSERNWRASLFMGPRHSKAIGWKQYWLSSAPYLVLLRVTAISATAPEEPIAVWSAYYY